MTVRDPMTTQTQREIADDILVGLLPKEADEESRSRRPWPLPRSAV
jgi:hypothetical protein